MCGTVNALGDHRADAQAAAERTQQGKGLQLAVALDADGVLKVVQHIAERHRAVHARTGVGQFQHARVVSLLSPRQRSCAFNSVVPVGCACP